jgi:23S rRNA pseudouridine2605 synthase
MIRLNKFIASCGVSSRRNADKLIEENKVTVNGKRVTELGTIIDESKDVVKVSGNVLEHRERFTYLILNKPKGYITTAKDEKGRKTVFDLIKVSQRVFPVGRLDAGSEGLLLFTNNGELANRLMHPRYKVSKNYRAKLDSPFNPDDFEVLTSGIELDDGITAQCKAGFYTDDPHRIEMTIHEGKNRQIRRMFEAIGYEVKTLKRMRYGPVYLNELKRGKYRFLNSSEVWKLLNATKLLKDEKQDKNKK